MSVRTSRRDRRKSIQRHVPYVHETRITDRPFPEARDYVRFIAKSPFTRIPQLRNLNNNKDMELVAQLRTASQIRAAHLRQ